MQPTLFGVTAQDLKQQPPARIPTGLRAWVERWVFGRRYFVFVAQTPGRLTKIEPPEPAFSFLKYFPLLKKQRFQVGETWYTLWLPPSDLPNPLGMNPDYYAFFYHAGLLTDRVYRPGEVLVRMRVARGDNLLVDRFTYNFRRPRRGEILVFRTEGVPALQPGTHYIKRLVGLSGEKVRLGNDRHAIIDGQRLDATTPHFENVYSFTGPPRENQYSGHVNDLIARLNRQPPGTLASLFPRETSQFAVRPRHYFLLGDNTMNSYDSRRWGDLPQERVIGKFCLVYWPLSHRFGWGQE
jgi:signal peptidase I